MARRRARSEVRRPVVEVADMTVSARVAWTYLAVLLALTSAGLVVTVATQVIAPLACPPSAEDFAGDLQLTCQLGAAIWSGIAGFFLCLIPAVRLLKLDWWLWAAVFAGAGLLVAVDAAGDWWWWLAVALLPAVAALVSADWGRGARVRRVQVVGLLVLVSTAIGALVWWFFSG